MFLMLFDLSFHLQKKLVELVSHLMIHNDPLGGQLRTKVYKLRFERYLVKYSKQAFEK